MDLTGTYNSQLLIVLFAIIGVSVELSLVFLDLTVGFSELCTQVGRFTEQTCRALSRQNHDNNNLTCTDFALVRLGAAENYSES